MAVKARKPRKRRVAKTARASAALKMGGELVRSAAVVLDEEMAIGITTAKAVQQRFVKEGRIEPGDFKEAIARFQLDARDLVNTLNAQLSGRQLPENAEMAKQFLARANDMIDLTAGMVATGAELANKFLLERAAKSDAAPSRKRRR